MVTKVKGSVWDSGDNGLAVNVKDYKNDDGTSVIGKQCIHLHDN